MSWLASSHTTACHACVCHCSFSGVDCNEGQQNFMLPLPEPCMVRGEPLVMTYIKSNFPSDQLCSISQVSVIHHYACLLNDVALACDAPTLSIACSLNVFLHIPCAGPGHATLLVCAVTLLPQSRQGAGETEGNQNVLRIQYGRSGITSHQGSQVLRRHI